MAKERLSMRKFKEVLRLKFDHDLTNRQIAARLMISPETVKTHLRNAQYKFDVHSKAELRALLSDWDFSAWDKVTRRRRS